MGTVGSKVVVNRLHPGLVNISTVSGGQLTGKGYRAIREGTGVPIVGELGRIRQFGAAAGDGASSQVGLMMLLMLCDEEIFAPKCEGMQQLLSNFFDGHSSKQRCSSPLDRLG